MDIKLFKMCLVACFLILFAILDQPLATSLYETTIKVFRIINSIQTFDQFQDCPPNWKDNLSLQSFFGSAKKCEKKNEQDQLFQVVQELMDKIKHDSALQLSFQSAMDLMDKTLPALPGSEDIKHALQASFQLFQELMGDITTELFIQLSLQSVRDVMDNMKIANISSVNELTNWNWPITINLVASAFGIFLLYLIIGYWRRVFFKAVKWFTFFIAFRTGFNYFQKYPSVYSVYFVAVLALFSSAFYFMRRIPFRLLMKYLLVHVIIPNAVALRSQHNDLFRSHHAGDRKFTGN